jgi:transcriptional regulator with PAS, ATPase and Fis domain
MAYQIVFIAPYEKLAKLFSEVCCELNRCIPVEVGDLKEGVQIAKHLEEKGVDVIISRGGTAIGIKHEVTDLPVVEVQVSTYDLVRTLHCAQQKTKKIAVCGCEPFTYGVKSLEEILDLELEVITIEGEWQNHPLYIEDQLKKIMKKGFRWLVGDNISVKVARLLGMNALLVESGKESLIKAIMEAEKVASVRKHEIEKAQHIRSIVDFAYEGIISVNCEGVIDVFNPRAEEILGIKDYRAIGENMQKIPPVMELLKDVHNGNQEKGKICTVGNNRIIANIIPIKIDNELVRVVVTFQKVSRIQMMEQKIREEIYLKEHVAENTFQDIIAKSRIMKDLIQEAKDYAQIESPIFLCGETGTGKELFAQAIHNESSRCDKPFVAFNCAALSDNLIESELFGYVEGAFTGAVKKGKLGLFEQAHRGTIFLDEISAISLETQVRLLRVIQEGKIRKIGDDKITPVDVRIIVATNQNLQKMVREGKFREDLYYRINVLNLNIPPLRKRKSDIHLLVNFFIQKYQHKLKKIVKGISKEALMLLQQYDWPGNIRQLENTIEKLMVRTRERYIMPALVKSVLQFAMEYNPEKDTTILLECEENDQGRDLRKFEKYIIEKTIREEHGNKKAAAKRLGIGRTTLWRKLNQNT